jgi:hypothetical protein
MLPALTVSAAPAAEKPLFEIPVDTLSRGAAHRIIVIDREQVAMVCLLLVCALALVWAYPWWVAVYRRARRAVCKAKRRYAEGPAPAWRELRRAMREHALPRVIPALYRWMDRSAEFDHPARLDALDASATGGIEPLRDALNMHYGDASHTPPLQSRATQDALRRAARAARKKRNEKPALPPLNQY